MREMINMRPKFPEMIRKNRLVIDVMYDHIIKHPEARLLDGQWYKKGDKYGKYFMLLLQPEVLLTPEFVLTGVYVMGILPPGEYDIQFVLQGAKRYSEGSGLYYLPKLRLEGPTLKNEMSIKELSHRAQERPIPCLSYERIEEIFGMQDRQRYLIDLLSDNDMDAYYSTIWWMLLAIDANSNITEWMDKYNDEDFIKGPYACALAIRPLNQDNPEVAALLDKVDYKKLKVYVPPLSGIPHTGINPWKTSEILKGRDEFDPID